MKTIIFFIMFIFVSCTQALLNLDLCINEATRLNPSNCTQQQLSERLNASLKDATVDEYQLAYDSRKASSGRGTSGGGNVNTRPSHGKNSAESLLSGKIYWASYANLAMTFLFPF